MTVNLYSFIDLYDRALATAAHLLDKGVAHAAAEGVSETEMLAWRLIDDMHPLSFQLMVAINFSRQWPARVAGLLEAPAVGVDLSVAQFKQAIADARHDLAALTPAQFEGRDQVPLAFKIGEHMEPTLPAGQWLAVFATTNIHFHLSTAYGILRAHGVPIGKADLFARGL
ncbi:DUF1993 family protein [Caulobacter sp. LARHSG274]